MNSKNKIIIPIILITALIIGTLLPQDSPAWVIDPAKCVGCGTCAEACVRPESAVKAEIDYSLLESVELDPAVFKKTKPGSSTSLENRICPTDAIKREKENDSTWIYSIDSKKCIGCGACAIRSKRKGSGAFKLKITDKCLSCNECSIAIDCPAGAIKRAGDYVD